MGLSSTEMDPQVKLTIGIKKMGALVKRLERKMEMMEERIKCAETAVMGVIDGLMVLKIHMSGVRDTWPCTAKAVNDMEEQAIMDASLNEDTDFDDMLIEACESGVVSKGVMDTLKMTSIRGMHWLVSRITILVLTGT